MLGGKQLKNKRYGVIYIIKNKINNKVYIGKTKRCFSKRYESEGEGIERVLGLYEKLKNANRPYNKHLYNSILKYGKENFEVNEEFFVAKTKESLDKKEIYFIKKYKSNDIRYGYNKTGGGDGGQDKLEYNEWLRRKKISAERRNKKTDYIFKESLPYLENKLSVNEIFKITGFPYHILRIAKQRYLGNSFVCSICGLEEFKKDNKKITSKKYCSACAKKVKNEKSKRRKK